MAKRFGSNKLLADWQGKPLICRILESTEDLFGKRVVVTRHKEVADLCRSLSIDVILHNLPNRNDTVRLGLEILGDGMQACMICQSDQPLLTRKSIIRLAEKSKSESSSVEDNIRFAEKSQSAEIDSRDKIWRLAYGDTVGTPVLFPAWTFEELKNLPEKKGGGYLMKQYPDLVGVVQADSIYELQDADTPEELQRLLTVCKG